MCSRKIEVSIILRTDNLPHFVNSSVFCLWENLKKGFLDETFLEKNVLFEGLEN